MRSVALLFLLLVEFGHAKCHGRFVNPITDICWSCLFPISLGSFQINSSMKRGSDTKNPSNPICWCPGRPIPGLAIGFWEPVRLVDVVREPFCMVNLGGISLASAASKSYGGHHARADYRRHTNTSFYHLHWYAYPVIYWLELIADFICLEKGSFDVGWMSEFDPMWNDDKLASLLNPEAVLFGNLVAQAACSADCAKASVSLPIDKLFWCGGCQGSLYPFAGHNHAHVGGVQASALLVQRFTAKLHRTGLARETSGSSTETLCNRKFSPIIKKSQYRLQMVFPKPATKRDSSNDACPPYGKTDIIWGAGREIPHKGEDFGYLIWRKRNCCAL
ncbi:MAG: conjugal transfer pilus assembly protein TraU [Holosporales bacterium]